jgi:hypothetical protein
MVAPNSCRVVNFPMIYVGCNYGLWITYLITCGLRYSPPYEMHWLNHKSPAMFNGNVTSLAGFIVLALIVCVASPIVVPFAFFLFEDLGPYSKIMALLWVSARILVWCEPCIFGKKKKGCTGGFRPLSVGKVGRGDPPLVKGGLHSVLF